MPIARTSFGAAGSWSETVQTLLEGSHIPVSCHPGCWAPAITRNSEGIPHCDRLSMRPGHLTLQAERRRCNDLRKPCTAGRAGTKLAATCERRVGKRLACPVACCVASYFEVYLVDRQH